MRRVFSRGSSWIFFAFASLVLYALAIWLPNIKLIYSVAAQAGSPTAALSILGPFFFYSLFDISFRTALYPVVFATIVALNIVLITFFVRMNRALPSYAQSASTLGAAVAGMLGLGCAACGSLLAWTVAVNVGGLGIASLLPYRGAEIGYAGLVLLGISTIQLTRAINRPVTCPI